MSWASIAAAMSHSTATMTERYYGRGTGARDWFARAAAEHCLRAALADAQRRLGVAELEAYRVYHGTTLRTASALALALLAHEGRDVDEAAMELLPDGDTPLWLVGPEVATSIRRAWRPGRRAHRSLRAKGDRARFLHSGRILRRALGSDHALGIALSEHGLEVALRQPGWRLRTAGDLAIVVVEEALPMTLRLSLVGRPIGDLIDHPVLRDPAYVITGTDDLHPEWSLSKGAWRMTVSVPCVRWRLPWAGCGT